MDDDETMLSGLDGFGVQGPGGWRPAIVTEHTREHGDDVSSRGYSRPRAVQSVERFRRDDEVELRRTRDGEGDDFATYRPDRADRRALGSRLDADADVARPDAEPGRTDASDDEARERETGDGLTHDERDMVAELRDRDREVRAHENAHASAGGGYASAPSYTYQTGPDGKRYAIGGEVQIDAAPVEGNPEATIEKMRIVIRAAMAPAEPSGQDQRVAASATQTMLDAQRELTAQRAEAVKAANRDRARATDEAAEATSAASEPSVDPFASAADTRADAPEPGNRVELQRPEPKPALDEDAEFERRRHVSTYAATRYQLLSPREETYERRLGGGVFA